MYSNDVHGEFCYTSRTVEVNKWCVTIVSAYNMGRCSYARTEI